MPPILIGMLVWMGLYNISEMYIPGWPEWLRLSAEDGGLAP